HKPHAGWFKLNIDGAFHQNRAEIGGVIRNNAREWIMGFHQRVQAVNCTHAEIMALSKGLDFISQHNLWPCEVETDSTQVIDLLREGNTSYDFLLQSSRSLISQKNKEVVLRHSFREGNQVAHLLAQEGTKQPRQCGIVCYVVTLTFVESRMLEDKEGFSSINKLICESSCRKLAKFGNLNAI
ncbi:hypothetical protein A4A49_56271, partial [Nicotiana attenuata]